MLIIPGGRRDAAPTKKRSDTFSGEVWADTVLPRTGDVTVNHVFFTPGARTYWHSHEAGQLLHVTSGEGWVRERGGQRERIAVGDLVWTRAGEEHWHGATDLRALHHLAVSLGTTTWLEEVGSEPGP